MSTSNKENERNIKIQCGLTVLFCLSELVIGIYVGSVLLLVDGFHMFSDILGLIIGLVTVKLQINHEKKQQQQQQQQQHHYLNDEFLKTSREETRVGGGGGGIARYFSQTIPSSRYTLLGGLVNSLMLLIVAFFMSLEAINRMVDRSFIDSPNMVIFIGFLGLCLNTIGLFLFHEHGHSHGGGGSMSCHSHEEVVEMKIQSPEKSSSSASKLPKNQHQQRHQHFSNNSSPSHSISSSPVFQDKLIYTDDEQNLLSCPTNTNDSFVDDNNESALLSAEEQIESRHHLHHHHHSHCIDKKNYNMKAIFLHICADFCGAICILVSGLLNKYIENDTIKWLIDPLLALSLSIVIGYSVIPMLTEIFGQVLLTTPQKYKSNSLFIEENLNRLLENINLQLCEWSILEMIADKEYIMMIKYKVTSTFDSSNHNNNNSAIDECLFFNNNSKMRSTTTSQSSSSNQSQTVMRIDEISKFCLSIGINNVSFGQL